MYKSLLIKKNSFPQYFRVKWFAEVRHHCPNAPVFLVGTKLDLRDNKSSASNQEHVSYTEGHNMSKEIGALGYFECSAMLHKGLKTIFDEGCRATLYPPKPKKTIHG